MLSWRGVLACHAILLDVCLLYGRVAHVPFWIRTHWAAEALWFVLSFMCIQLGMHEICAVCAPWLGIALPGVPETTREHDLYLCALFSGLTVVHLTSIFFVPSAQRRRLASLGAAIAAVTAHTHLTLGNGTAVRLLGTYGRPFEPIRHVLWAHTSPGLALIVSGPSMLPMCETNQRINQYIVAIMVAGFLATAQVPSLVSHHAVGLWGWRATFLAISTASMVRALAGIHKSILRQNATKLARHGLFALVVTSWSVFPTVWLLAMNDLLGDKLESQLLGFGDFLAKQLAAVVLCQGAAFTADAIFYDKQRSVLNYERERAGMLQTFARTMGHDLRTPLQALVFSLHMCEASVRSLSSPSGRGSSELAPNGLQGRDSQMAMESIRQASSCVELLSLIVSNLWELDSLEQSLSRPGGSGRQKVLLPSEHVEQMDLKTRFASMVELLKSSPQAKPHVLLQLVVDDRIPLVMCDASRLTRALLNLMVNSLKFTSSGAVTLSVTLLDDEQQGSASASPGHVTLRFEVSDTGRGMTDEEIACVTEAYVCSQEDGGMGLGLAIVTQAVASLGGQLTITSPGPAHGSTCRFTLRLERAPLDICDTQSMRPDEAPMRVLLADDVDVILSGARQILTDLGHEVTYTASDGEALLKILMQHADEIDIAFVDIRMPKLFGDAAIAQYRSWEREARSHLPPMRIYGASGDATSATVRQLMTCGFDGILAKPVYPKTYENLCRRSEPITTSVFTCPTPAESEIDESSFKSHRSAASTSVGSSPLIDGSAASATPANSPAAANSPAVSSSGTNLASLPPHATVWGWDKRASRTAVKRSAQKVGEESSAASRKARVMERLPDEILDARQMIVANGFPVEVAVKLLQNFQRYLEKMVDQMRTYESDGAWTDAVGATKKSIGALAHQVKGAALQVCAQRLVTACRTLQKAAEGGKSDQALVALETWFAVGEELLHLLSASSYETLFHEAIKVPQPAVPVEETVSTLAGAAQQEASKPEAASLEDVRAIVREAQLALAASHNVQLQKLESIAAALGSNPGD